MNESDFSGQIAVVTGASSGIGKAIAVRLAENGAVVCLVGRNIETLEGVFSNCNENKYQFQCYQADLSRDDDIVKLKSQIMQNHGYIDLLIHSAGWISHGRIESASIKEFDRHYQINLRAPYLFTQLLLPILRDRKGQIVFINSSAGYSNARANVSQYAATKHALKAFADSLREEVNADGIRVLSIYPGRTASHMQEIVHQIEGKAYYPDRLIQPEDIAKVVIQTLNLPRSVEVTDIYLRPMMKPI
jgi:NADP-dependent 3-hydroxy acid dehydrogenase YdfG